jgi:hypothetical protein
MGDTSEILSFIRARLDEDEAEAQYQASIDMHVEAGWPPHRVLVEVDVKRRHVARWEHVNTLLADAENPSAIRNELLSVRRAYALVIADDALPYADRPGYREEWRP